MRYFKKSENNTLISVGTGIGGVEITEEEYNTLLSEIRTKAELVDKLYSGEISIEEIPSEWQEEIQRRADERKVMEEAYAEEAEATEEDFINVLIEVGVI